MIEDSELRVLFQAESEERLANLEKGLKKLESDLSNQEVIEGIFRDAHSIKGAARMLNVQSIEKIAHQMEELLDGIRRKRFSLTSVILPYLYEAIDAMHALVEEAVKGVPSHVNVEAVLRELNTKNLSKQTGSTPAPTPPPAPTPAPSPPPLPKAVVKEKEPEPPSQDVPQPVQQAFISQKEEKVSLFSKTEEKENKSEETTAKILHRVASHSLHTSTIRIHTEQLNELMTQAGNLTVAKSRIFGALEQIEQMISFIEKIPRTWNLSTPGYQSFIHPSILVDNHLNPDVNFDNIFKQLIDKMAKLRDSTYEDTYALGVVTSTIVDRIRKLGLVPLANLFDLFPRMVSELAHACSKEVDFSIEGEEITVDKRIIEEMKDPIMHMLRNAISHGIEPPEERERILKDRRGKVKLKAYQTSNTIVIEVSDDGRGLNLEKIKEIAIQRKIVTPEELEAMSISEIQTLIFMPGFSTASTVTEISGRGVGMDVVQAHTEKLSGSIQVESELGQGCRIFIQLPITLVTTHVLLVEVESHFYAIPIDVVESCELISSDQLFTIEGKDVISLGDQPISVALMADLLSLEGNIKGINKKGTDIPCLVLKMTGKRLAILVDAILEEQQVVVVPPHFMLQGIRTLAGATILKTGQVCVVINPYDLIKDIHKNPLKSLALTRKRKLDIEQRKKRILYVDDSYTLRLIIKRVMEGEGYEVVVAENGIDALEKLSKFQFDAVVSDVEMPKMDGITLTTKLRLMQEYYALPIILLTTLSGEENRKQGLEAGATAYLIKSDYNQNELIETLQRLFY